MFGAMIGDLVGFPYEYAHEDLTDRSTPLFRQDSAEAGQAPGEAQAGEGFSDKTVLTAAMEAGLLQFERRLPEIIAGKGDGVNVTVGGTGRAGANIAQNAFEEAYKAEVTSALRRFGQEYPLAGYTMDLSIWIFREGGAPAQAEDAGPAARVSPVAWTFQEDLYMMRHMARLQAALTHRGKESIRAAEAAACAVFLAIHKSTKPYIAEYLEREFGYKVPDEKEMREEILRAGGSRMLSGIAAMHNSSDPGAAEDAGAEEAGTSLPALCVRAAMTAFLNGRDFEDVLRRAVSLGGNSADITAIAGSIAEAFFGIPQEIRDAGMQRLPGQIRKAAEEFAAREAQKKAARDSNPAAKARWENALTRASSRHPAAVQGNEELELAIDRLRENRDKKSFAEAVEMVRLRMNEQARVFVPLVSARRAEPSEITGSAGAEEVSAGKISANTMVYSMQTIRTRDGKLWQPAYTSRPRLDQANAAQAKARAASQDPQALSPGSGMVLSYALDALLKRFLPAGNETAAAAEQGQDTADAPDRDLSREMIPAQIEGIVLNPYDKAFFLPRKTIEAIFLVNRQVLSKNINPDVVK